MKLFNYLRGSKLNLFLLSVAKSIIVKWILSFLDLYSEPKYQFLFAILRLKPLSNVQATSVLMKSPRLFCDLKYWLMFSWRHHSISLQSLILRSRTDLPWQKGAHWFVAFFLGALKAEKIHERALQLAHLVGPNSTQWFARCCPGTCWAPPAQVLGLNEVPLIGSPRQGVWRHKVLSAPQDRLWDLYSESLTTLKGSWSALAQFFLRTQFTAFRRWCYRNLQIETLGSETH